MRRSVLVVYSGPCWSAEL